MSPLLLRACTLPFRGSVRASGLALAAGLILTACAARMEVREMGAGGAPSFYELRGQRLGPLREEAARRCPKGFRVARTWERGRPAESGAGPLARGRTLVEDFLWPGAEDQAQLTIQCEQGGPVFEPKGLPPTTSAVAPALPPLVAAAEQPRAAPSAAAPAAPASAPPMPRLLVNPPSAPNARTVPNAPNRGATQPGAGAKETRSRTGAVAAPSPFSVPASGSDRGSM
jgi:hypothetical protein